MAEKSEVPQIRAFSPRTMIKRLESMPPEVRAKVDLSAPHIAPLREVMQLGYVPLADVIKLEDG